MVPQRPPSGHKTRVASMPPGYPVRTDPLRDRVQRESADDGGHGQCRQGLAVRAPVSEPVDCLTVLGVHAWKSLRRALERENLLNALRATLPVDGNPHFAILLRQADERGPVDAMHGSLGVDPEDTNRSVQPCLLYTSPSPRD